MGGVGKVYSVLEFHSVFPLPHTLKAPHCHSPPLTISRLLPVPDIELGAGAVDVEVRQVEHAGTVAETYCLFLRLGCGRRCRSGRR